MIQNRLLRGKQRLKKWNRDWKIRLIDESNLEWRDPSRLVGCVKPSGHGVWVPAFAGTTKG